MLVETAQIMPITQLQKTLTQTVRKISEDKQPVFIMKNNIMEAVIMPFDRYEKLLSGCRKVLKISLNLMFVFTVMPHFGRFQ